MFEETYMIIYFIAKFIKDNLNLSSVELYALQILR